MGEREETLTQPEEIASRMLQLKEKFKIVSVGRGAIGDLLIRHGSVVERGLTSAMPADFDREKKLWRAQIIDQTDGPNFAEETKRIIISQAETQALTFELENVGRPEVSRMLELVEAGLRIHSLSQLLGDEMRTRIDHGIYPSFIDPGSHHSLIPMMGDLSKTHEMVKSLIGVLRE